MARNYSNVAVQTTLSSGISNSTTTLSVGSVTGYPAGPFTVIVDPGLATEELIEVGEVSGTDFNDCTRGVDGTPAQSHSSGSVVVHGTSARDFREPNDHVTATTSVHGIANTANLVTLAGTQTLTNKTINSSTFTGTLGGQPTINDFTNADHNHTDTANGGVLTTSAVTGLEARLDALEEGGGGDDLPWLIFGTHSQISSVGVYTLSSPVINQGSMWSSGSPTIVTISQPGIYEAGMTMKFDEAGSSGESASYLGFGAIDLDPGGGYIIATEASTPDYWNGGSGYSGGVSMSWQGHLDSGDLLRVRSASTGLQSLQNHLANFYIRCLKAD